MWTDCRTSGKMVSHHAMKPTMVSSKTRIFLLPFDVSWIRLEVKVTDCEHSIVRVSDFGTMLTTTTTTRIMTMTTTTLKISTIPVCCNYLWFNQEEAWSPLNSIGSERCWLITSTSPFSTKIDWSGQSDLRRIRSPFLFFFQTRSTSTNLQRQQWLESTFKGGYF